MSKGLNEQFNKIKESLLFKKLVLGFREKMDIPQHGFFSKEQEDKLMSNKRFGRMREGLWEDFMNQVKMHYSTSQALEYKISDYLFFDKNLNIDTIPFFKGCSITPDKNNTIKIVIFPDATQKDIIDAIKNEWSWIEVYIRIEKARAGKGFRAPVVRESFMRQKHETILLLRNLNVFKSDGSVNKLKAIKYFESLGEIVDSRLPEFKKLFIQFHNIDISKKAGIRQAINRQRNK